MEPPRKKPRGLWTLQQLEAAMAAVQGNLMSQRAAAARYSIPRRTLVNHLKSGKVEKQIGRRTILTAEQENELASRIKRLASVGFPLTPKRIRHQAYVFCEQNEICHNFNQRNKMAGKDWLKLFLKRHRDISKRKVQILNPGRAQKLNKAIVMHHFEEYKKIYDELEIGDHPHRLYNMDEKGCRLTIHNQPMVLAQKGVKRVHMVAPEHAENVTVAACVNALGNPIPPMIIFKGKRLKAEFKDNLPAGSLVKMAPKGSMTTALFIDFIHHLGKYKSPGKCLLIFDGASCHLDYRIVDAADEEDIVLYCLPSNTTHELQPLDKSVNKSFEHHWDEETLLFLYQHPEKKLNKARFNKILSKVWSKCMTHANIVAGFRATGLYPYNPDAIAEEAYAPAVLTEIFPAQELDVSSRTDPCLPQAPSPGFSHLNADRRTQDHTGTNSDSNETYCEDNSPSSPSLLKRNELSSPVLANREIRLVDYSSTNSESSNSNLSTKPGTSGAAIRRPIIYSSDYESDESFTEALAMYQRQLQSSINLYRSSENENIDPLSQHRTPEKHMKTSIFNTDIREVSHNSSTSDGSEDNVPLISFRDKKDVKSKFHQLLPTPNLAVVKQKPRRKAINYKAQVVTKDLFNQKNIEKPKQKEQQKRQNKEKKPQQNKGDKKTSQTKKKDNRKDKAKQFENGSDESGSKKQFKKTNLTNKSERRQIDADDKWYCHACNTESFEDMRQCPMCQRWFHEQCLGLTKDDVDFECPKCD